MDYEELFLTATDLKKPYDYQRRLAVEKWPDLLDIPTGLGKTAAIVLAWLYKRRILQDPHTPRRLVYCLPMRVLVEQTERNVRGWLSKLSWLGETGERKISVHLLMGGEPETKSWAEYPEEEMVVIGTQDMLLSRALMRGYGISRYRWPIDFALLHNDALWVFDEIQLMGAGLPTSTQLEAFRRDLSSTARSIWVSATLNPTWLETIDFRTHCANLDILSLDERERQDFSVKSRLEASKMLASASVKLNSETDKAKSRKYLTELANEIFQHHQADTTTLVIVNNVERAQGLYERLSARAVDGDAKPEILLLHARFRQAERRKLNDRILNIRRDEDLIVVATQALEAGVDVSSRTLFTELAPWSSLVQRFGRCNRAGEHGTAHVYWIDVEQGSKLALPYTDEELRESREKLTELDRQSVAPANLPNVEGAIAVHHVLRRKDLLELFDTDADLSGFDIDISPYIRDGGRPSVQVYWRDFSGIPEESKPVREEICPASIGQVTRHLEKADGFFWDTLSHRWMPVGRQNIKPGMTLLLRSIEGGYSTTRGFVPGLVDKKRPLEVIKVDSAEDESYEDERSNQLNHFVSLPTHLKDAAREASLLCEEVGESRYKSSIVRAARWHDVGKAHPAMQSMFLLNAVLLPENACSQLWAKNDYARSDPKDKKRAIYAVCESNNQLVVYKKEQQSGQDLFIASDGTQQKIQPRRYFRHELASALAWLERGDKNEHHDLIAYLIAAHHGKVRMGLRALPIEEGPGDGRRFARGIWDGDYLPAFDFDGESIGETTLRLDVMELGEGEMGASWTSRTQRLLMELGPFQLSWMETLLRIADWRASKQQQEVASSE